ncbi:AbgT family transporter [Georgenia sp. AZ-5]|uniref:AbgT family transporter n=1 Tax=Georgenia sp. AZ-5 TaxID=3367526 RepID=UPI003753F275
MSPTTTEKIDVAAVPAGRTWRLLSAVERWGNRLPHPFFLFLYIAVAIIALSAVARFAGWSAVSPSTGESVQVRSLLSGEGAEFMVTSAIDNFVGFPPLGLIVTVMLGIGVAQRSGLLERAMRSAVMAAPPGLVTFAVVLVSMMGNLASDSAMVILPPLAAAAFMAAGRHPIAGFVASYSAVAAGFSANLLPAGTDVLLAGITTEATSIVQDMAISPVANWYFMGASTLVLAVVITFACQRFVEPRLGPYTGTALADAATLEPASPSERRALLATCLALVLFAVVVAAAVLYPASPLRGEGGAILRSPFMSSLPVCILLGFLLAGVTYGKAAGTITHKSDVPAMMAESVKELAPFLVVIFSAAQAIAYFDWTQLGLLVATEGAAIMEATNLDGIWGLALFAVFVFVPALLMVSGSGLWTLLAPIFVPMFMINSIDPAYVQAAFRISDSATNPLVPMNPMLPVVLGFMQQYDRKAGLGTLFSLVLPFTVTIWLVWMALFVLWGLLGLPVGPGHGLTF